MKLRFCMAMAAVWVLGVGLPAAEESKGAGLTPEQFEAQLGYQTGTINLPGGMVTIKLPDSFRFLGAEGSRRLLTDGWATRRRSPKGSWGCWCRLTSAPSPRRAGASSSPMTSPAT